MQRLRNLHAAFHGTAALNAHLHLWGFVDDAVFLTKAGGVGMVLQVRGVDVEGLDVRAREHAVDRWAAALRTLGEAFRVYQYQLKTPLAEIPTPRADHPVVDAALMRRADALRAKADTLFTFDLVYVVIYEGWTPRRDWRARLRRLADRDGLTDVLSTTRHASRIDAELSRAVRHLRTTVDAMIVQLADTVAPRVMAQGEAFTFFRRLLNYTPGKAEAIPYRDDAPLDFTIGDSTVEGHRDHLRVDDHVVRVLTLKMPPAFTHAHLLADLATLPTAAIVCLEWQRISNGADATRPQPASAALLLGEDLARELRVARHAARGDARRRLGRGHGARAGHSASPPWKSRARSSASLFAEDRALRP